MSRRSVPRDTAKALVPVLVPLLTKVVLPIAIESMRRRKFDPDQYLDEARESLGKGLEEDARRAGRRQGRGRRARPEGL